MINFLRYTKLYFLFSTIIIVLGFFFLIRYGIRSSIDFSGGSVFEYEFSKSVSEKDIREIFKIADVKISNIYVIGKNKYQIRAGNANERDEELIRVSFLKLKKIKATVLKFDMVGPSVGQDTLRKTVIAAILASLGILLYMTYAFKKTTHGIAAIIAMIHDFIVLIGTYSIVSHFFGAELDTLFVTAILTTLSFSVHDTIVVFDKIREYQKISGMSLKEIANKALTETMVRSINNSLTIVLMLIPLVLFAGTSIRFFALALLIGTITGTYSSPFIATPLLVIIESRKSK